MLTKGVPSGVCSELRHRRMTLQVGTAGWTSSEEDSRAWTLNWGPEPHSTLRHIEKPQSLISSFIRGEPLTFLLLAIGRR